MPDETFAGADRTGSRYTSRELLACLEVGKILLSTLDLREILGLIMTRMSELMDARNWSLLLKDEETGALTFEVAVGIDREAVVGVRLARGEGVAGHVAETGESLFLSDVRRDPRFCPKVDEATGFVTTSIICVPLQVHGKVVGVIEVVNPQEDLVLQWWDHPVFDILADYAAIAIENSRHVEKIRRMSVTDDYTGLWNARYLHELLDCLIDGPERHPGPIALVFADIDNFKRVVDTHGHLLGSRLLREVGEAIASRLAETDILTKYGGDEYVIVLPGRTREEARCVMEGVREAVRERPCLSAHGEPVRVTASFGMAMYPEDAATKKDLLILADTAMYTVKRAAKDGICDGRKTPDAPEGVLSRAR